MKKILLLLVIIVHYANAQTFLHGTTGINGERVTHCLTSTCTGSYFDNGGIGGTYSNNIAGGLYRVFCPTIPGNCIRVTFNTFNTEPGFDFLTIGNGATQNSPVFTTPPAIVPTGRISGTPAVPFSYTANNSSGCLTFRFTSDASITRAGWDASLSCVPCATPGNGPNLTDNNDCSRATPLCSGIAFNTNSRGPGLVAEGCTGSACPAGGENHTNWYTFTIQSSGTLTLLIDPQTNTDDYDFAIYGPNVTCNTLGSPLRCTDSGNTGNTGLNTTAGDATETVTGDGFLAQMNVTAGQTYILVVDEWMSNTGNGYTLSFGGTATLDCSPILNLKLLTFSANYNNINKNAILTWSAISEAHYGEFIIERSQNGYLFDSIGTVISEIDGSHYYEFIDNGPIFNGYTYYRLRWLEDNNTTLSDIAAISVNDLDNGIMAYPNPTTDIINIENFSEYVGDCKIYFINALGQIVKQENFLFGLIHRMEFNIDELPAGVYTIMIETNYIKYLKITKI